MGPAQTVLRFSLRDLQSMLKPWLFLVFTMAGLSLIYGARTHLLFFPVAIVPGGCFALGLVALIRSWFLERCLSPACPSQAKGFDRFRRP